MAEETTDFQFEALRQAPNYRSAILREFASALRGTVIEVGCGIGQMTELLLRHPDITRLICIEPDSKLAQLHRASYPKAELIEGTTPNSLPRQERCNAIISTNVLEHIERDTDELALYQRLLLPGQGRLCLFVPARPELYSPIDRDFGHFRRYTFHDLANKLRVTNFAVDRLSYFNLTGYFTWYLNFRLLRRRHFSQAQVSSFDSFIFPATNWIERKLFRPPFGQSIIAVATAK